MKITVRETVRMWGYEWTEYETDMTVEDVKAAIVADPDYFDAENLSDVTEDMVAEWLAYQLDPVSAFTDVREIMDREGIRIESSL